MPRIHIVFTLLLAMLCGGCGPLIWVSPVDGKPVPLAEVNTRSLCLVYGAGRGHPELTAELERRGAFTRAQWDRIYGRTPIIGDSLLMIYLAFGKPQSRYTSSGGYMQLDYGSSSFHYMSSSVRSYSSFHGSWTTYTLVDDIVVDVSTFTY